LLCVLAAPLAHATSTSLTVDYAQLSFKSFSSPAAATPLGWLGYGAGAFTELTPGTAVRAWLPWQLRVRVMPPR
jgi:hypothetical protein